jgi:hypothetical protein
MKKRLIYAIISTVSVIIGAFFFPSFGGDDGGKPQVHGMTDDSTFVNMVRMRTVMYTESNDSEIVSAARGVCAKLDQGMTPTQARESLIISSEPTIIKDADFMMAASITQYCTKYSGAASKYLNQ